MGVQPQEWQRRGRVWGKTLGSSSWEQGEEKSQATDRWTGWRGSLTAAWS